MSTRIFTDAIVAAQVLSSFGWLKIKYRADEGSLRAAFCEGKLHIYISCWRCEKMQKIYVRNGVGSVLSDVGNKEWSVDDYRAYMNSNARFFTPTPYDLNVFEARIDQLVSQKDDEGKNIPIKDLICKYLLTIGTYDIATLKNLGF